MTVVVSTALAVNLIGLIGGPYMYQPDSGNYLVSSFMLWQKGTWVGIGLNRVPGYAAFLALILGPTGVWGIPVMATVQHALAVAASALVIKIGDMLDDTRILGLVAGVISAFSLQFQSYARLPMSEVLYGVLTLAGLWLYLAHLRGGKRRALLAAIGLFCLATLVRPTAQLIPWLIVALCLIRAAWPTLWSRTFGRWPLPDRKNDLVSATMGAVLTVALLVPWCVYNWVNHGYFGLTGTFGINLYSNTVEYGGFMDESSPSLAEIRRHWDEFEAKQTVAGQQPETTYTWRNHWPSARHVMGNTGWPMWKADELFKQAAFDAIRAHPGAYARQIADNIYITLMSLEPTYNYINGLGKDERPPHFMRHAWSLDNMERVRAMHDGILQRGRYTSESILSFGQVNALTPVYGALLTSYHAVVLYGNRLLVLFGAGLFLSLIQAWRGRSEWWIPSAFIVYSIVIPALVAPGAPRHRLPSDPVICLFYAAALTFAFKAVLVRYGSAGDADSNAPIMGIDRGRIRFWMGIVALTTALITGILMGGSKGMILAALAFLALVI